MLVMQILYIIDISLQYVSNSSAEVLNLSFYSQFAANFQ